MNKKGVSMISLVITIVVLIIIASVTIYYGGIRNIDQTTTTGSYTEALNVSEAVVARAFFNRANNIKYPYIGTPLTNTNPIVINEVEYGDGWYELLPKDALKLDLENVKKEYVINYLTGEVVSKLPVYVGDDEYYTLNDMKEIIGDDTTTPAGGGYNPVKGVNKPVLIKGMIPVRNVNGKWIVTSAEDDNWYDYSSDSKTWANVMLNDEIVVDGFDNEAIRKADLITLEGREVIENGSMFVWIPRYTSNGGSIVFSELLYDYTADGYTLNEAFRENGDVTGIWISKYDPDIVQ